MTTRDPREPLREADAAFQTTPLPPQVLARLRRRVFDAPPAPRARWLLAASAVAVIAAVAAWLFFPATTVEDVRLAAGERYRTPSVEVLAIQPSRLRRDHAILTIHAGELLVTVAKRTAGEDAVRLQVSHGWIEILGTRFTVEQRADGGRVTLHEGSIRFIAPETERTLKPGQVLEWPLARTAEAQTDPPVPAAVPEPVPPAPPKTKRPAAKSPRVEPAVIRETDARWLLEEVELLRSRGEYVEAVRLLDKGLDGLVSPATRERFSFELGSILTYQQSNATRACAHWTSHRRTFPAGRYEREIRSAMETAQCEPH